MMAPNVLPAKVLSLLLVGGLTILSLQCGGDGGGVTPPDEPAIALSATSKSFSGTQGEADPAAQTAAITNAGVGTLDGLATEISYTAGQPEGWLNAELSATTAPSTLALTATTGSLPPGTYTANVAVSSAVAGNSPQLVAVTFTLAPSPSPLIALSSTSQGFTAEPGGEYPVAQAVAVANGGAATLDGLTAEVSYTAGEPTDWLVAELSGTTAPTVLTLTATTGALVVGNYTASVAIASPVAGNTPQTVAVTFTVTAPPEGLLYSVSGVNDGLSIINPRTGKGRFIGRLGGSNTNLYTSPLGMGVTLDNVFQRSIVYVWNNTGDGTTSSAHNGELLTLNTSTGEPTPVNPATPPQGTLNALAVAPSGEIYGGDFSDFYSVDPETGIRTLIGSFGPGTALRAMDFACDGTLYAVAQRNGSVGTARYLLTINTSTAALTEIGPLPINIAGINSIAFTRTGSLIGSASSPGNILFDINITSGQVSNVRPISGENVGLPDGMGFVRSVIGCRT
jgi:hypothetical protein